jgi:Family of unknown function (DUF6406)
MSVGVQVHVGKGGTFDRDGLGFGGVDKFPPQGEKSASVVVCVWAEGAGERDFELSVGESLEFAGQTWRLDEIDDNSRRWYATLTRVA